MVNQTLTDTNTGNPAHKVLTEVAKLVERPQDLEPLAQYCMARPQYKEGYTTISWNIRSADNGVSEIMIACLASGDVEQY